MLLYGMVQFNEFRENRKDKLRSIGTYIFDFNCTNIDLVKSDSLTFKNLKLTLKKDNKFYFTRKFPYINDSSGLWKVEGFGVYDYITLYFENGTDLQISECCGSNMEITMSYPLILNRGYSKFGNLCFKKIDMSTTAREGLQPSRQQE